MSETNEYLAKLKNVVYYDIDGFTDTYFGPQIEKPIS